MSAPLRRLAQRARAARARAALSASERQEAAAEWLRDLPVRWRRARRGFSPLVLNDAFERAYARYAQAIVDFDDWFNARWYRMVDEIQRAHGDFVQGVLWQRLQQEVRRRTEEGFAATVPATAPPMDTAAMALIGAGAGGALQGYPWCALLGVWGVLRGIRRFAVQRADANDMQGLFRYLPPMEVSRRQELFGRLKREIETFRALRRGDLSYADTSWIDKTGHGKAMDPEFDYTPEMLFDDAMTSVAQHPRVQSLLGRDVRPETMPDKVVYRIHEGISEVALGWTVAGELGSAEIQVKATASIVDYIYVFPQCTDRYGFKAGGFVIRPNGAWSQDCDELPRDYKVPFGGEKSGRLLRNRRAVFEWDWTVKDFRHGYEDHPRKHRKPWW